MTVVRSPLVDDVAQRQSAITAAKRLAAQRLGEFNDAVSSGDRLKRLLPVLAILATAQEMATKPGLPSLSGARHGDREQMLGSTDDASSRSRKDRPINECRLSLRESSVRVPLSRSEM